MPCKLVSNVI